MAWTRAREKVEASTDVRALKDQASASFQQRRYDLAAGMYRRLCDLEPNEGGHALKLGDALHRLGCKRAAIEAYHSAIEAFRKAGDPAKAMAACQLVLGLQSNDARALQAMAGLRLERRFGVTETEAFLPKTPAAPAKPRSDPPPAVPPRQSDIWDAGEFLDLGDDGGVTLEVDTGEAPKP